MKVKIFHSRKLAVIEEAVNDFLASNEVSVINTQFSTVYAQDDIDHVMFHTLLMFYYPRVDEPDPFAEEEAQPVTRMLDTMHDKWGTNIYFRQDNPYEGIDGYHNQISGYSCTNCHDQGCYQCLDATQLYD